MDTTELKVTSITDLQAYARGAVVELPPFAEGQPFVARLRRPSMLALVKSGKIPNELLAQANEMFLGTRQAASNKKFDPDIMPKMLGVFDALCEASFVEPKYSELQENGIELTDDQYAFIYNYTQTGVNALKSFREEQGSARLNSTK